MNSKVQSYFLSANSCEGFVSFFSEYLADYPAVVLVKNATEAFNKQLFEEAALHFLERGVAVERILCAGAAYKMSGLCMPEKGVLLLSEKEMSEKSDALLFDVAHCRTMDTHQKSRQLLLEKEEENHLQMFRCLKTAKVIHDQWEKIYISHIDFKKCDAAAELAINMLLENNKKEGHGKNQNRFFGTMTPDKPFNVILSLTEGFEKRIFIKGRPGTGKSTLLKRVREEAQKRGFDTETYYCSFDPNSLDMVVIRSLSVCIFDSTPPHELFPTLESDSILDIYALAVESGTDERFKKELSEIQADYNAEMQKARLYLGAAHAAEISKEQLLVADTDSRKEKALIKEISERLLSL